MMSAEITGVSQCRGGLAPAASLKHRRQVRRPVPCRRVPCVAVTGSQARPVVITACSCRKIAAAMTACAWVGKLVVLLAGQVPVPGGVDAVGALCSPDRAPDGQPQAGASLAGQPGPAGERAGQFLPRRQAGVLDQRPSSGEPPESPVSARIAAAPTADRPVIEVTREVSPSSSTTPVIRCSASASRDLMSGQSSSSNCTRTGTPGRCAITRPDQ